MTALLITLIIHINFFISLWKTCDEAQCCSYELICIVYYRFIWVFIITFCVGNYWAVKKPIWQHRSSSEHL